MESNIVMATLDYGIANRDLKILKMTSKHHEKMWLIFTMGLLIDTKWI